MNDWMGDHSPLYSYMEQNHAAQSVSTGHTIYHAVDKDAFTQFCQKYNMRISPKNDLFTIYHLIFWLYHQFPSYRREVFCRFHSHNGFEIFEKCRKSYMPNCACFAIMLNDLLISMGFQSKAIWCLSADPNDEECHALNHVWLEEQKQWVVADPSSRSVICDEDGKPLNLLTMRERIYAGKTVYPHRNRSIRQSDAFIAEYNQYIRKNMYQFLTHPEQGLHYPLGRTAILIQPEGQPAVQRKKWKCTADISYLQ